MSTELEIINPKTIATELQKYKTQMEAALPRHMTADRMARIALTSLRVNPKLMNCTSQSFYGSLMAASQLGLEPGVNGQCYLIPYKTICTLVPGWRGFMDLVNRTERATASTEAVYDGDEFDYTLGTKVTIHHKHGKWNGTEAALMYVYAVGHIKGLEDFPQIDVWDIDKIWAHRDKNNKCFDKRDHYSYKHPEMYARKIPLLQVIKYLPSSIELASASALDVTATEGRQALTIDMALKGELENGAGIDIPSPSDPIEHELDALFEKLGTNASQQRMLREGYAGKTEELVTYLKGRLAPEVQTRQVVAGKVEEKIVVTPAVEAKRGRGRPSKEEMARRKAEENAVSLPPTTEVVHNGDLPVDVDPTGEVEQEPVQNTGAVLAERTGSAFDLI